MDERPLRIAVLGTRGFPGVQGGVERHCENLYPRLARRGCRVRVYTRKAYGDPCKGQADGVERYPLWAPRSKGLEAIVHTFLGVMHVATRRRQFDILHIHAIGPSLLAPIARLAGIRVVVTNHGPDYERKKWGGVARLALRCGERWGTRYSNAVIAVARNIRERLERQFNTNVYYIPNGMPSLRRQPPGDMMQRFRLGQGRYALAVGRFVPEKGFHDLLQAYERIDTDWKLVLTGGADHRDEYSVALEEQAKRDKRVVLTGVLTGKDLEEIYSNAGCFVLPSYHEGLPLTLLEALGYNLPVLASDIPANREIINEHSRLFAPGNVERLSALLRTDIRTITEGNRPSAMNAVDLSEFDWEKIADRTLAVYEKVML